MGRRTDTRQRIIDASLDTMRAKGFASSSISDIVKASRAPRGSVTFHFPGGKDEIAAEVVALRAHQLVAATQDAAANSETADEFLVQCFDRAADDFEQSGYLAGCPVVPIAIDRASASSSLARASADFFTAWRQAIRERLIDFDIELERAEGIAALAVFAIEGALVVARLERDREALATARDQVRRLVA